MSEATTIDVPGLGPTKSVYVYTGVAATLGVIGYAWWSRRNAAPAVDPNAILADPTLTQNSGGTTTPGITTTVSSEVPDPGTLPPNTNIEWSQRVTEILVNTLGYDAQTVAEALGAYLARQGLTSTQANIIRTAWGQLGRPPIGDFPITLISTGGTTTPPPPPPPPPPAGGGYDLHKWQKTASVSAGQNVDAWITGLITSGKVPPNFTYENTLLPRNDHIATNINWHPNSAQNTFKHSATYNISW